LTTKLREAFGDEEEDEDGNDGGRVTATVPRQLQDDDGSRETLSKELARMLVSPTATQTVSAVLCRMNKPLDLNMATTSFS